MINRFETFYSVRNSPRIVFGDIRIFCGLANDVTPMILYRSLIDYTEIIHPRVVFLRLAGPQP